VSAESRAKTVVVRVFIAHLIAYPIAFVWALGSIPLVIVGVVAAMGTSLDDAVIAHHVLLRLLWPVVPAALLAHLAGVVWGLDRNEKRGRRLFIVTMAVLGAVPVVVGGVSWIWLVTR
jgi:hypothetical protein